jgi:hypothetical protein
LAAPAMFSVNGSALTRVAESTPGTSRRLPVRTFHAHEGSVAKLIEQLATWFRDEVRDPKCRVAERLRENTRNSRP